MAAPTQSLEANLAVVARGSRMSDSKEGTRLQFLADLR